MDKFIDTLKNMYKVLEEKNNNDKDTKSCVSIDTHKHMTNVVSGEKLRDIQSETLAELKDYLSKTFGPMGSNTKIIKGNNRESLKTSYSKDGLKVLQNIENSGPIEASIIEDIIDITRHVEHEVGDGTTSTVILSSLIFDRLLTIQKKFNIPPHKLIKNFEKVVDMIKEIIKDAGTECTIQDIYDISMISTNSNIEVSNNIRDIYEKYGMDVDLSVGISNTTDNLVKAYDGLTITEGMSDPVFINNINNNTAEIRNAHIYHFVDPIDTMEMISLFEAIIGKNIYEPLSEDRQPIPTVITCPRISKDMSASLKALANHLYQFNGNGMESSKPPVLIVTNVVASDEVIMDDIANLCGCKSIRKYIDPKMLKKDQEEGKAPTIDNITEFAGKAELVVSDAKKTKFINPLHMRSVDEEGNIVDDPIYTAMVNFLETEIANSKSSDTASEIGLLKKRLSALKANMVEYLVGGVTISERDATKDLVEDAIKNCKSAAKYGVGRAANFEGLNSSYRVLKGFIDSKDPAEEILCNIASCIFDAYFTISEILYGTICNDKKAVNEAVIESIENGRPFNISTGFLLMSENNVKCSIMLDINILDTISKIITIMVTCNQCLLQSPQLNNY